MSGESLIVPVDVEAMWIGAAPAELGHRGATADFSALPGRDADGYLTGKPYIGESIAALRHVTIEPGIHLHWALPDALTKGVADAAGGLAFPPVPTRWLVVRILVRANAAAAPALSGWVVESDFLHADPAVATVSVPHEPEDGEQFHRFLGRRVALAEWRESGDPPTLFGGRPLTALGYGETSFAAYYPNCRNVFGFHDPLDDLGHFDAGAGDRLAYLVAGWFPDAALEPRLDLAPEAGGPAWSWSSAGGKPGRIVCSGLIRGIGGQTQGTAEPAPLEIAIGNTPGDCVSALLAGRPNLSGDPEAIFLLDAAQAGVLADTPAPDFHVTLDHALHATGFSAVSGETVWQVAAAHAAEPRDAQPRATPPISEALAERLAAVNSLEADFARETAELAARREMLVLDWRRLMQVLHGTADESILQVVPDLVDGDYRTEFSDNLRSLIETECQALGQAIEQRGRLTRPADTLPAGTPPGSRAAALAAAVTDLAAAVRAECGLAMALKAAPGPRFFEPADPVVLIAGEDARPPVRYGGDGRHGADGRLPCRRTGEVQASLAVARRGVFDAAGWLQGLPLAGLPIAAEARALVAEALLTDPALIPHLAAQTGAAPDALAKILAGASADGVTLPGVPVAPLGRRDWQGNPWLPLFLDWKVEFLPVVMPRRGPDGEMAFPVDALSRRYAFDGEAVDLSPLDGGRDLATAPVSFEGTGVLTQSAFRRLTGALEDLLAHSPDNALRAVVAQAAAVPALSHALHGFNQALTARRRAIELSILDPLSPDDELTPKVAALTPDRDDTRACVFSPFLPIRGGYLSISRLSLIDVFGQQRTLDVDRARIARARRMIPADVVRDVNHLAELPPRFLQPARLNFRFLDARDEGRDSHAHPASSPVCGWVMVNNLDPGLAIYTAAGAACGMLRLVEEGREVVFEPMPGAAPVAIDDPHLAGFVSGLLGHAEPAAFLEELADVIDRSLATIIPGRAGGDEALGLLIGRPLALVRASLSLELKGGPRARADWQALSNRVTALGGEAPAEDFGFANVNVPVRLGNLSQVEDGLVGYFLEGPDGTDYRRFFAAVAEGRHGVDPSADNAVLVAPADWRSPARVTLLMDPFGTVHASCGLLPVKGIELPLQHYAGALAGLEASFSCGPVLSGEAMRLPLPALAGYGWGWVEAEGEGWRPVEDIAGINEKPAAADGPLAIRDGWLRLQPRLKQ